MQKSSGGEPEIEILTEEVKKLDSYYRRLEPVIDIELKLREEALETTGAAPTFSAHH
ncbi:MAG: hypothetical protein WAW23_08445 [Candidatus Methanoperedens sp.]